MSLIEYSEEPRVNPLDVVERVAATNGWSFERAGDEEITILVTGKWSDYQVSYTWMFDIEALHLACAFELKVPERSRPEVQQLISHDQSADVGGSFRSLEPGRSRHVSAGAGACGRR